MGKDPAFLFYPNDWLGETMGMTFEQKGAYLELLLLQFNRGHMPLPLVRQVAGVLWDVVQCHFEADAEGRFYNVRLEEELLRRRAYTASRRSNLRGKQECASHMEAHMDTHMEAHMETGTGTETEAESAEAGTGGRVAEKREAPRKRKAGARFVPPSAEEVAAYCAERGHGVDARRFVDFYASKGWMVGKSPMKDWRAAVRGWEADGQASARARPMGGQYSEVI